MINKLSEASTCETGYFCVKFIYQALRQKFTYVDSAIAISEIKENTGVGEGAS